MPSSDLLLVTIFSDVVSSFGEVVQVVVVGVLVVVIMIRLQLILVKAEVETVFETENKSAVVMVRRLKKYFESFIFVLPKSLSTND